MAVRMSAADKKAAEEAAIQAQVDAAVEAAVKAAVAAAKTGLVAAESKPEQVDALRSVWRKSKEHYKAQVVRFLTLLGGLVGAQVVDDLAHNKPLFHEITDARSLISYLVPIGYVAWRQLHPSLTASQVDSAPGVTIVPSQVGAQTVDVAVDKAEVEVALPEDTPDPAAVANAVEGDAAP